MDHVSERQDGGVDAIVPALIDIIRPYGKTDADAWSAATEISTIGIDSFDFVEIVFKIEDLYAIDIDYNANTTFNRTETIGDLAAEVARLVAAKPSK